MRFNQFKDNWVKQKNNKIFESKVVRNNDMKHMEVLSASQEKGMVSREETRLDIKYKKESIKNYKVVNKGDYVIHLRSFQGGFAFSNKDGVCSPAYTILSAKEFYQFIKIGYIWNT